MSRCPWFDRPECRCALTWILSGIYLQKFSVLHLLLLKQYRVCRPHRVAHQGAPVWALYSHPSWQPPTSSTSPSQCWHALPVPRAAQFDTTRIPLTGVMGKGDSCLDSSPAAGSLMRGRCSGLKQPVGCPPGCSTGIASRPSRSTPGSRYGLQPLPTTTPSRSTRR